MSTRASAMSDTTTTDPAVTYGSYLKVDELLALQQPRSAGPEHDEMLFIVIHQVYELWFKELLHELDRVAQLLKGDEPHRAQHTLKRMLTILKVMVAQLDILETMTPLEFLSFRERLEAASGFQSDQFRQIEFVLGAKSDKAIARFPEGSRARAALRATLRRADAVGRLPALPRARRLHRADRAPHPQHVAAGGAVDGDPADSDRRSIAATEECRALRAPRRSGRRRSRSGDTVTSKWSSARSA